MGDPAGIGPEVILKALAEPGHRIADCRLQTPDCRIIGSRRVFELEQKRLGTRVDLSVVDDSVAMPGGWKMGRVQESCGRAAFEALEAGCEMLETGRLSALVTAPVSKEALRLAGFAWPGQTEFLADRLGAKHHAMLAWTPGFKAVFVTIHLPLAEVARRVTATAVLEKTVLLNAFLQEEGMKRRVDGEIERPNQTLGPLVSQSLALPSSPRICAMALNPHGFEFSAGEDERIAQGVRRARRAGINAFGPIPADAALSGVGAHNQAAKTRSTRRPGHVLGAAIGTSATPSIYSSISPSLSYDGFVAMYHDQAMIPAKLLGRDSGVNVTLGLPFPRTSPLHGTAFDIAGKCIARPGSMLAAVTLARRLSRS
jgi:4-hydroxy-L-threonine phosphate dehydrogenase PdxA